MYPLLAAMLSARPWNLIVGKPSAGAGSVASVGTILQPGTPEERLRLRSYAAQVLTKEN